MINFMIYSTENGQVEHRKGLQEEAELQRQRQRVNDLEKEVKALEAECLGRLGYRSEKLSIELTELTEPNHFQCVACVA